MDNYDPNTQMRRQRVRLTFQQWKYTAEMDVVVGGNCTGFSVIETAIESAYDKLTKGDDVATITLRDAAGTELEVEDSLEDGEDWLKAMCIGAEIMEILPPKSPAKRLGSQE